MVLTEPAGSSNNSLNVLAGLASVSVAIILIALKLWALIATGSLSVAASLADSALDLLASGAGLAAIIYAVKPADEDHAFGHSSAEDLAALGQSVLVTASACVIAWNAIQRLMTPGGNTPLAAEGVGLVIMLISLTLTGGLVLWQGRVARRTGSKVVAADRMHYLADLLPNLGAIIALLASAFLDVSSIDSIVALVAAAVLLAGALGIGRQAWHALMDRRADPNVIAEVSRIAAGWPGITGYHDLKTRTAGTRVFIQLHVEIDGALSLSAAHDIGAALRRAILEKIPNADVIIHKDPV